MELCSLITCLYRPGHLPIARLKFENEFEFQTTVFYFVYRQLPPPHALTIKPSLHWTVKKISHRTAFKIQNREANLRYIKVRLLYSVRILNMWRNFFCSICNFLRYLQLQLYTLKWNVFHFSHQHYKETYCILKLTAFQQVENILTLWRPALTHSYIKIQFAPRTEHSLLPSERQCCIGN